MSHPVTPDIPMESPGKQASRRFWKRECMELLDSIRWGIEQMDLYDLGEGHANGDEYHRIAEVLRNIDKKVGERHWWTSTTPESR